ncbi:type VI secretion system Vgr family protein [Methylobacterium persicinum]
MSSTSTYDLASASSPTGTAEPTEDDRSPITLKLGNGPLSSKLYVERVAGREAISETYEFRVTFHSDATIKADDVLGQNADLTIRVDDARMQVQGVVAEFQAFDPLGDRDYSYEALIVPQLKLLAYTKQNQVYGTDAAMSVTDLIEKSLSGTLSTHRRNVSVEHQTVFVTSYDERRYIVQYDESDLNFLSRWCEHYGIFYFFHRYPVASKDKAGNDIPEMDATGLKLVEKVMFSDTNTAFKAAPSHLRYWDRATTHTSPAAGSVTSFRFVARIVPQKIILQEYDYNNPATELNAEADVTSRGIGEIVAYGENYATQKDGKGLATVRAEEIACRRTTYQGKATHRCCGRASTSSCMIILRCRGSMLSSRPSTNSPRPRRRASPGRAGQRAHRSATGSRRSRSRPLPSRTPHAPAGGRWPVHRQGRHGGSGQDGRAGPARRVPGAPELRRQRQGRRQGERHGAQGRTLCRPLGHRHALPLLRGTEVMLACVNGDIDRPVILGALFDGANKSVVTLDNATHHRIRTRSGAFMEASHMGNAPASSEAFDPESGTQGA